MSELFTIAFIIGASVLTLFSGLKTIAARRVRTMKQPMALKNGDAIKSVWHASELGCRLPATRDYVEYDSPAFSRTKIEVLPAPTKITAGYASPWKVMFEGEEFLLNYGETPEKVLAQLEKSGAAITAR